MCSWNSYQIHLSLLLFAYSLVLGFFHLPICASKASVIILSLTDNFIMTVDQIYLGDLGFFT